MTVYRILVCGGRDYKDRDRVFAELDRINEACGDPICVIAGGATGADAFAEEWARSKIGKREGISFHGFKANWKELGRAAGPIRNQKMIDRGKPNLVLAFPGGRGTADMIHRAEEAGIPVRRFT